MINVLRVATSPPTGAGNGASGSWLSTAATMIRCAESALRHVHDRKFQVSSSPSSTTVTSEPVIPWPRSTGRGVLIRLSDLS